MGLQRDANKKEAPKLGYAIRDRVREVLAGPEGYNSTARLPSTVARLQRHKRKERRPKPTPLSSHDEIVVERVLRAVDVELQPVWVGLKGDISTILRDGSIAG